jgi:uncharacterized metal-binding protein
VSWWAYRKVISHRSRSSHLPFIGAAIRIVYLAWAPLIAVGYYNVGIHPLAWVFLAGLALADLSHLLLDLTLRNRHT